MRLDIELTNLQWIKALMRFRDAIHGGLKKVSIDDDTIGDKDTQFSWGMCSDASSMWPMETRLFPEPRAGPAAHRPSQCQREAE